MGNVLEFTDDNWVKEVEQSDQPVVVDFWATWCSPCRALNPIIEKVATQYAGKVKVGKVNIEVAPGVASNLGITSIPRIFIYNGGNPPKKVIANVPSEQELVKSIDAVLQG